MHYLAAHQWIYGMLVGSGGTWLLAGLISTMPPLQPNAGYWARWGYGFAQFIAANLDKLKNAAQPPLK